MRRSVRNSGFTLIELLVVIAIIAILAVVVVLTLNPAELLAESRDSTRISDMSTLSDAINLLLLDQPNTTTGGDPSDCYLTIPTTTYAVPWWTTDNYTDDLMGGGSGDPSTWFQGNYAIVHESEVESENESWDGGDFGACLYAFNNYGPVVPISSTVQAKAIDGTGWIPFDFTSMSAGSPIPTEPIDPVNQPGTCSGTSSTVSLSSCGLFYSYMNNGTGFGISAFMESKKYSTGGSDDVETGSDNGGCFDPYVYMVLGGQTYNDGGGPNQPICFQNW